jgi:glycosyltransferase involved in cell wall biosynthesis
MNITSWGREAVESAWQYFYGDRPGIVFTIWDPARCHAFLELPPHLTKWGYFAVDGHNRHGTFGGPAAEAVKGYQRVLAYGAYGAEVLTTVRADGTHVEALPHGIDTNVFKPTMTAAARASAERIIGARLTPETRVIGCVATNQARKDLGLVVETMASLITRGQDVHLWLHIDEQVGEAWSVPQLYEDYPELRGRLSVSQSVTDEVLAACYASCSVTIAPGRGEGFGYPILESQWCGTPVVGMNYGGGADYLPETGRVTPFMLHAEGPYNVQRPLVNPLMMASAIEKLLTNQNTWAMPPAAHQTRWSTLWPEWREWVAAGLTDWRETHGH